MPELRGLASGQLLGMQMKKGQRRGLPPEALEASIGAALAMNSAPCLFWAKPYNNTRQVFLF